MAICIFNDKTIDIHYDFRKCGIKGTISDLLDGCFLGGCGFGRGIEIRSIQLGANGT